MKKFLSVAFALVLITLSLAVPSMAAQTAKFKIALVQQDDKSITVTFDFDGGAGFSALDFDIKYNNSKLTLNKCDYGDGYTAFLKYLTEKGSAGLGNVNDKTNPIKVAIALLEPFKVVSGGSLVKMTFNKASGAKITEDDITVEITNCQTADFKDITVFVSTDLETSGASSTQKTQYPQMTSVDGNIDNNDNEVGDKPTDTAQSTSAVNQSSGEQGAPSEQGSQSQAQPDSPADSTPSNTKTVIIIIACVLCLAGAGAAIVIYRKKQKN